VCGRDEVVIGGGGALAGELLLAMHESEDS
jgi:hypothetical protein